MVKADGDGKLFKGSIRVWLNLVRPIKVVSEDSIFGRNPIEIAEDAAAVASDMSFSGRSSFARGASGFTRTEAVRIRNACDLFRF